MVSLLTKKERNMKKETIKNGGPANAMSLRDYFAAKAMQGLIAAPGNITEIDLEAWSRTVAPFAYLAADAMLSARSKRKEAAS